MGVLSKGPSCTCCESSFLRSTASLSRRLAIFVASYVVSVTFVFSRKLIVVTPTHVISCMVYLPTFTIKIGKM